MSDQQCFDFAREEDTTSAKGQPRVSEAEINRKLKRMQAMPEGAEKDAAAQEILDWMLENS
jgi:hypothetical protein